MQKSQGKAKGRKREEKTKCGQVREEGGKKEQRAIHLNTIQRTAVSQCMTTETEIRLF